MNKLEDSNKFESSKLVIVLYIYIHIYIYIYIYILSSHIYIYIKFAYNARCYWLKGRALSEYKT